MYEQILQLYLDKRLKKTNHQPRQRLGDLHSLPLSRPVPRVRPSAAPHQHRPPCTLHPSPDRPPSVLSAALSAQIQKGWRRPNSPLRRLHLAPPAHRLPVRPPPLLRPNPASSPPAAAAAASSALPAGPSGPSAPGFELPVNCSDASF